MGDKETAFGNFLRALATIVDEKPSGPVELTVRFSAALFELADKEPSTAKMVLKVIPGFWKVLKMSIPE